MKFIEQFHAARRVSTPLLAIRTVDAHSAISGISQSFADEFDTIPLMVWDCLRGLMPLNARGREEVTHLSIQGSQELPNVLFALGNYDHEDAIVFLSNAQMFLSNEPINIQGIWNLRDTFKQGGNMLVLLMTPGSILPNELKDDVFVIDEPLPTREKLSSIVSDIYVNHHKNPNFQAPKEIAELAVDSLVGLSAFSAEQSSAMCLAVDGAMDVDELWEKKRTIIGQTRGLTMVNSQTTLDDIGGMTNIKAFMRNLFNGKRKPKIVLFTDEIEKSFAGQNGMDGTKRELTGEMLTWMQKHRMLGMLLIGLPGTSKTAVSEAITNEFKTPMVNFNFAAMQSGIVGSSGENMRAAQNTVDAIAGDSQILFVATCNSIGELPPELRRRFRTATFFFDAPNAAERTAIWAIYRQKYSIPESEVTPADNGWTGAEIQECCDKADMLGITLDEAAKYIVPLTKSSHESVRQLREASSGKYLSASYEGLYTYHGEATEPLQEPTLPVMTPSAFSRKVRA